MRLGSKNPPKIRIFSGSNRHVLVGGIPTTPLKNMSSSIGMRIYSQCIYIYIYTYIYIYGKIKVMFQSPLTSSYWVHSGNSLQNYGLRSTIFHGKIHVLTTTIPIFLENIENIREHSCSSHHQPVVHHVSTNKNMAMATTKRWLSPGHCRRSGARAAPAAGRQARRRRRRWCLGRYLGGVIRCCGELSNVDDRVFHEVFMDMMFMILE